MSKKSLSHLLEPSFRLYFLFLAAFVVAAVGAGEYLLAGIEGVIVLVLFLYFRRRTAEDRKEVLSYLENITDHMDAAAKDTMANAPLPMVIFRPESEEVIWSNSRFLQITGERDHMFDLKISDAVPGFDPRWLMEGKSQCPSEVTVGERRFMVFGHLVRTKDEGESRFLATTYWVDATDFADIRDEFYATRPVVMFLVLDSYDEIFKGVNDNVKTAMMSDINRRLAEWAAPTGGMFCRYDRDRYLLICEEQYLPALTEKKFDIVDQVREVVNPNGLPATLSVAVGRDGDSFAELYQFATLALEMALSRGGDQAVVKNRFNFEFFGGRATDTEKHTKVKSRVMANALKGLIADASRVFVMGHKFPDLDCMGPAAGILAVARQVGVPAHIIHDGEASPAAQMIAELAALPEYENAFLSPADAMVAADANALLVVVDTNRPEQVLSQEFLESVNKVAVIDHHRRAASYIEGAALNYHEPYASSASELTTELLQYLLEPNQLLRLEAEALMAGIVLDSKNFTTRTGSRTFDAAAFLRRAGADTTEVRRFFKIDLSKAISRYEIMKEAQTYRPGIVLAAIDHPVDRVTAAQAADELLTMKDIHTSFVRFPDAVGRFIVSALRSGDTTVLVLL